MLLVFQIPVQEAVFIAAGMRFTDFFGKKRWFWCRQWSLEQHTREYV